MALKAYFDGSHFPGGGWETSTYITLAGYSADEEIWKAFDDKWNSVLADNSKRPAAKYLHMKEAILLDKEFSAKRGWNYDKVFSLINELLRYLSIIDKKRFHQFACTVKMDAYRKMVSEGMSLDTPIEIINTCCPELALSWYFLHHPDKIIHSAHFFFDQGEPFEEVFRNRWTTEKNKIVTLAVLADIWQILKSVTSADSKERPALQAADLFAWSINRDLAKPPGIPFPGRNHHMFMKNIVASSWKVWDEKAFREEYDSEYQKIKIV